MARAPTLPVGDTGTPPSHPRPGRAARVLRGCAAAAYVGWFVRSYRAHGFPFDRERVIAWVGVGLLITAIGRPLRRYVQVIVDWLPFAALLYLYDSSRGMADDLGRPVLVESLVRAERVLMFGSVPSEWLQPRLRAPGAGIGWWELGASVVYASHFVVPFLLAGVLWWRSRERWRAWVVRLLALSYAAVLTYALVPAAPPWYASQVGLLDPLDRPVQLGWTRIGVHAAPVWFERGQAVANAFAALPSLHAGYSALVAVFLIRMIGAGRWRWLLLAYPVSMGVTLVYTAEHYVVDVLAGWVYALAAMVACDGVERWWQARRVTRDG
jgi:hypothetical protein